MARSSAHGTVRHLDFGSKGKAIAGQFSERAIEQLAGRSDVRYVERSGTMHAIEPSRTRQTAGSDDPETPWGVDRIDADVAIENGHTGSGIDVAVIDTGIDATHPDLEPNLGDGKAFVECTGTCTTPWDDDYGHGTHVAGTVGAVEDGSGVVGVAPDTTLHAGKVLDSGGSGSFDDVAAGITWAATEGYDVINLSLGGPESAVVKDAVGYASDEGTLIVAAAGNDGPLADSVGYPAAEPEVIAVSATTETDGMAYFSSNGPQVELAAPGAAVPSTYFNGEYDTLSGTSMASPHVAGAGAYAMSLGLSNVEARTRLQETAKTLYYPEVWQGHGLVDAAAVLGLDSSDDTVYD